MPKRLRVFLRRARGRDDPSDFELFFRPAVGLGLNPVGGFPESPGVPRADLTESAPRGPRWGEALALHEPPFFSLSVRSSSACGLEWGPEIPQMLRWS